MISIKLVKIPEGGKYWQLILYREQWGDSIVVGTNIPVGQAIILTALPFGWNFPLYMDIFVYEVAGPPYNVIYHKQSCYGPDWPDYIDTVVGGEGYYWYDCNTGALVATSPDWVTPLATLGLLIGMVSMLSPLMGKIIKE